MTTLKIELPPKLIPVFAHPRGSVRYRGAYGGRGSGKSFTFAEMAAIFGAIEPLRILCVREFMNSIKESFHAEIKNAIASNDWLTSVYDVGIDYIRGKPNTTAQGTEFIFRGLRNNISSIKSLAQIDICIVEEAEDVPERSWIDLEPTIRAPKSEIWVIWNPKKRESPVNKRFRDRTPPRSHIVKMNYNDNPWFPRVLNEQRLDNRESMPTELYNHIWNGDYLEQSDAQIFAKKFIVEEFEIIKDFGLPFCGLDFGFSQDPTAATQSYIYDGCLYISHESGKTQLELDDTANYVCDDIPDFDKQTIVADSSRPESISHLKKKPKDATQKYFPKIEGAKKGAGSIEDGIAFIKSFKRVIIHPRCVNTAKEFELYSYKVDNNGRITDDIIDANNHYIDSLRYALEKARNPKKRGFFS